MRFLIIFTLFISNTLASEISNIENIVVNQELKTYVNIIFLDSNEKIIKLSDYRGNLVLLNFWASWCAPCKEEMPSLDALKVNPNLNNHLNSIGQSEITRDLLCPYTIRDLYDLLKDTHEVQRIDATGEGNYVVIPKETKE